jgi:hypothetical protein
MYLAILICALSLPAANFNHGIVSYHAMKSEEDQLKDAIRKRNPDIEDIFITPRGQSDKLKEYGWEKVPWTWKDLEIWVQRKPKSDQKMLEISA